MTRFRLVLAVLILLPVIFLGWLTATESGLNWTYQQAKSYLPVELGVSKVEGRLIGPITIKNFKYQQDGTLIQAKQIIVDWQPTALLVANINIGQLHIQSLNIVLPETGETAQTDTQSINQTIKLPEISLPWSLLLKNAEVDGLNLSRNNQVFNLKKVKLNATTLFSKINIQQFGIYGDTFSLDIKGKLQAARDYDHDLGINWQLTLPSSQVINGKGKLAGNMQKTRIKQSLSGPLQLTLDATLKDLLKQLNWAARAEISQFDIEKLDTSWPALSGAAKLNAEGTLSTATLTGNMQGRYPGPGIVNAEFNLRRMPDNNVQIEQLKLHAPKSSTHVETSGLWIPGNKGGDIKLVLNWQNLRWPVDTETAWFDSAHGSGSIEGNIDHYQFTLDSDSPWPQAAPSSWQTSAIGNLDGITFQSLHIKALNGEANVNGQLNWSPQFNWQAKGSVNDIDPATLLPQWPGKLNGRLSSSGRLENGQIIAEADISQLKGKLRDYPVSLSSRLLWRENHLHISQLNFFSGKSQIKLDGQLGETLKLDWAVNSNDLAELYPQAKGQLQAHGQLKGSRHKPQIEATFNGKTLSYPNYEVAAIEGVMAVDLFHWQKIDIQLAAKTLKINGAQLLSLDINAGNQSIMAKAVSSKATATVQLKGQAHTTGWRGRIEKADIQSEAFDTWQLDSPASLSIAEDSLLIEHLCWHSNQQARLCALTKRERSSWLSRITFNNFPLKLFHQWMPQDLKFESVANGKAEIEFQSPDTLLAQLDIVLPAGSISYPNLGGENDQREYKSGSIKATLEAQGLLASSEITMTNGDHFSARLELPGAKPLAAEQREQPLKASARLQARDLRLIEAFIPEIHDLRGELEIKLSATGTLEQPVLNASASIVNGALQIPGLGLNINQISLNSQSDASRKFNFRLDARSGDGNIKISGFTQLDRTAGWPSIINISGDQFEVSNIPEARLLVSPDLQINLKNRTINIKGKVHVPYAKLQPKDITQAAKVSNDAVIIGGDQPPEEKWLIHTAVRLTLGERVHFYGFGFEGRFGGNLLLEDEPGQLTKATGEITVPEGIYRAYGQRLEVENGRVLYTGSLLTNPGLDLRAVRKVNDVTAGIHVKGSLSEPQLEIFSTPAMGQTDALAYIILGGPIENASSEDGAMMAKAALALGLSGGDRIARLLGDRFGLDEMRIESSDNGDQAALVVGRYLSPKLYASYGVGLIDSINTITLRYQISKKWQLKAESGEYQGADILYIFER